MDDQEIEMLLAEEPARPELANLQHIEVMGYLEVVAARSPLAEVVLRRIKGGRGADNELVSAGQHLGVPTAAMRLTLIVQMSGEE